MKRKLLLIMLILAALGTAAWSLNERPNLPSPQDDPSTVSERTDLKEDELRSRIGQMLMVGFRGMTVDEGSQIVAQIRELNLGGVILFDRDLPSGGSPRNIQSAAQVRDLISDLQRLSPTPLFIGVDAEGGKVNRLSLRYGFTNIPSHAELGVASSTETERIALKLGENLASLGINMNFAPVVDVNTNPQNPIIGELGRSFSSNPQIVTQHASAFISGMEQNRIISVIKHFPGHGSSARDTHLGLVDVTASYRELELEPFKELSRKAPGIMTAHVINRKIDPKYPTTLSATFLQDILRKNIGFQGLIISDDMQMGAIVQNYGFEEAIVQAITSGVDMLILSNNIKTYDPNIAKKAHEVILKGVREGKISEDRIIQASDRIRDLKLRYGITSDR